MRYAALHRLRGTCCWELSRFCCRCLHHGLYKVTKKSKVAVIPNLRGDELAQAAKVMMYITADTEDVSLVFVKFEEWHSAIAPEGGHTVESIARLQRTISEYDAAIKASSLLSVSVDGMAQGFETVTSHRLVHLPEAAGALGYANAGDTTFAESKHKKVKLAWEHTSRRPDSAQSDVCAQFAREERRQASFPAASKSVHKARSVSSARAPRGNVAVGTHPTPTLRIPPLVPGPARPLPTVALRDPTVQNLWPPDSLSSAASGKSQVDIVQKALRAYCTSAGRDLRAVDDAVQLRPICFHAGVRLFDASDAASSIIGIARASPQWGRSVRYNDVRVVIDENTFGYARMALVMRVLDEDLVLLRNYREPTDVGNRTPARKHLDELLGPMLEFVPLSDPRAWEIVPAASLYDVWKLEDDVRKHGRFFVNQFVGAYRPTESVDDDGPAVDHHATEVAV